MKKYLIVLLLLLTFWNSKSQNVAISYGLAIEKEEGLFASNASLKYLLDQSIVEAKNLNFNLIINESGSKFYHDKVLNSGVVNSQLFTLGMAHYNGMIYDLKDKLLLQIDLLGENIFNEEAKNYNWTLTTETKLIDNYICYKATNFYVVTNGGKVFNHPVTAWYCSKLPYPYGPNGYGNLPGLILELRVRNTVYGAKSIDLNTNLSFDLNFLKKIKILDDKQLQDAFNKQDGF
jgi:GLPGLI family protein